MGPWGEIGAGTGTRAGGLGVGGWDDGGGGDSEMTTSVPSPRTRPPHPAPRTVPAPIDWAARGGARRTGRQGAALVGGAPNADYQNARAVRASQRDCRPTRDPATPATVVRPDTVLDIGAGTGVMPFRWRAWPGESWPLSHRRRCARLGPSG
jgi:hypothetical protein